MKKFLYYVFIKNWHVKLIALALAALTVLFINL